MPCKLLRFATGLPNISWSTSMLASLRFNAPVVEPDRRSALPSKARKMEWCDAPETSRCKLCREGFSKLRRWSGLSGGLARWLLFSWPAASDDEDDGAELPESDATLRARLRGDFGDGRGLESGREGV